MEPIKSHIDIIKSLPKLELTYDHTWVGSNPNRAFLICVGSGPWKIDRRRIVQEKALDWLDNKDLRDIKYKYLSDFNIYPLNWQNYMLYSMVRSLKSKDITFLNQCSKWEKNRNNWNNNWKENINEFFDMCGTTNGTKVLWLFVRDYLQFPAFPIDRWIKKFLKKYNLPQDSWYMINICLEAGINPSHLNRSLFYGKNPNFSDIIN